MSSSDGIVDFEFCVGVDRWMLDKEQDFTDVVWRMVILVKMVWFEWWNWL